MSNRSARPAAPAPTGPIAKDLVPLSQHSYRQSAEERSRMARTLPETLRRTLRRTLRGHTPRQQLDAWSPRSRCRSPADILIESSGGQLRDTKITPDVQSMARFAIAYTGQNERDHAELAQAARDGRIEVQFS